MLWGNAKNLLNKTTFWETAPATTHKPIMHANYRQLLEVKLPRANKLIGVGDSLPPLGCGNTFDGHDKERKAFV